MVGFRAVRLTFTSAFDAHVCGGRRGYVHTCMWVYVCVRKQFHLYVSLYLHALYPVPPPEYNVYPGELVLRYRLTLDLKWATLPPFRSSLGRISGCRESVPGLPSPSPFLCVIAPEIKTQYTLSRFLFTRNVLLLFVGFGLFILRTISYHSGTVRSIR